MKYENQILDAIETIVNNAVDKAGYDRTIQAKIINCDDPTIGKYKVQYQDSIFYAYSGSSEISYTSGSEVYILIPNNDMSRDKTILGSVSKLGRDYAVSAEGEEAFEIIGNNCVESNNTYELCSYETTNEYVIYDVNESNNNLRLNLKSINQYIKSSSSIILAATIKTSLPTEQQFRGNYGIVYEMVFKDNATGGTVTRNYVLDVNNFEGNPYKLSNYKRQVGIFDIDGVNFNYISKIYLFCYDFPNQASGKNNDILIKDLEICGSQALSASDLESCSLSFITPQGVYFDNNDLASVTRTIMASVRVKGKYINPDSQKLPYYWFVENNGITSLSRDYNAYGGQGWKCLNNSNVVKSAGVNTAPVVEWIPADYTYTIKKSDSDAKETRYKCVVLYNDIILSKTITIINYSSNYEITIESDSGTQFYYDIGNPSLTCKVNGQEQTGSAYTYQWAEIDNNNNFYVLDENNNVSLTKVDSINQMINNNQAYILSNYIYTFYNNNWINTNINITNEQWNNDNKIYNNAVVGYTQLQASIAAETAMPAASQEQLNSYLTIINSYDKIMRIEGNKIHKLQVNTITNFTTYKCSVYHNGIYIGTSSIVIKNNLNTDGKYSLVINNGQQVFKYNEDGVSPTSNSVENPYQPLPLSFTIFNNLGEPLSDDVARECNIKWMVPNHNNMIQTTDIHTIVGLTDDYNIYDDYVLNYKIDNKYNVAKKNNNIRLQVTYKDMTLTTETDFTFAKEGDPGTNGTEFLCKIVPNTNNDLNGLVPMIIDNGSTRVPNFQLKPGQENKWFIVELWHNGEKIYPNLQNANQTTEGKAITITWSMLRNKYKSNISDSGNVNVTSSGSFSATAYDGENAPANIVKCQVDYDGVSYFATLPLVTTKIINNYNVGLYESTGFQFVTYGADGRKPSYDNSAPFRLKVTKVINGYTEDISTMTQDNAVTYTWNILGQKYHNNNWINDINIQLNNYANNNAERNEKYFKPNDDYDTETVNNAIECNVTKDGNTVARIHIPIHLLLNKYGHKELNGWDGNSIQINNDGGFILAPEIGAGEKDRETNAFTGLLMGKVKEVNHTKYYIGLHGYNKGERTIFLNAEQGSALLGKQGTGQVVIDPTPTQTKGYIYSGNFWKNYGEDGLPSSYNSANENGQGMLIDLTTPGIRWGSGHFSVDANGNIIAKGGGTIAGWNISDDKLYSTAKVGNNPKITLDSSTAAIYSNNKSSMISNNNGFYIGSDGFSLGAYSNAEQHAPFQVNEQGYLVSTSGIIGNFNINKYTLIGGTGASQVGMCSTSGQAWAFWAGSEDSGSAPFHVGHNGALYASNANIKGHIIATSGSFTGSIEASSGHIGGWSIGSSELTSTNGNIHIYASGTLKGPNWEINANGNATFNDIRITQSGYGRQNNLIDFNNFKVYSNGNFNATGGEIAGWTVNGEAIFNGRGIGTSGSVGISPSINGWAFWAGNGTFRVDHNGNLYATSGNFTGDINSGSTITGSSINGGTITGTTLSGCRISGSIINAQEFNVVSLDATTVNSKSAYTTGLRGQYVGTDATFQIDNNIYTFKNGILIDVS